ncbi:HDIG domain-containing protein, partial [bacterium]|nr:HDIG domain-containing protein [bacterium]
MADIKEYIDNDSPLIQRFKEVAPGTYRHCNNVAQLCIPIAKELGLHVDNLMVAATLHDVGKMFYPEAFIENTVDDKNMHDALEPTISYQLISRHVSDSVLKLIQYNVPSEIIKIASEHHGNSIMKAIYNKAVEKNANVVPEHYRYKSSRPSSPESCVLMICDVVESACRASHNAGKLKDPKIVIEKLINTLTDEEQIDILSLGQLRVIKKIVSAEIINIYHKRVDYDEV